MFLEQQISILQWFLKDHVTLENGVMMQKIQLCITGIRNKNYIKEISQEYITFKKYMKLEFFWIVVISFTEFYNIIVFTEFWKTNIYRTDPTTFEQ